MEKSAKCHFVEQCSEKSMSQMKRGISRISPAVETRISIKPMLNQLFKITHGVFSERARKRFFASLRMRRAIMTRRRA